MPEVVFSDLQILALLNGERVTIAGNSYSSLMAADLQSSWNLALPDSPNAGFFRKFHIVRRYGLPKKFSRYFVLDIIEDPWAVDAAKLYATRALEDGVPDLHKDMMDSINEGLQLKGEGNR